MFTNGISRRLSTHAIDTSSGNEIFGATAPGFVKNYSYPAYAVQCGTGTGNLFYFGIQATYTDAGGTDRIVHRTWKCTVQSGTRETNAIVHTSHANLLADSNNRLIEPSILNGNFVKLGMGNLATANP